MGKRPLFHLLALGLAVFIVTLPLLNAQSFMQQSRDAVESRFRDCPRKNGDRQRKLEEMFRTVGCIDDQLTEQPVKGEREPNVVCTLRGQTDSVIIVGAHFDNDGRGGGVVDNWSGASLLPTLYQSLKEHPHKHTIIFIGFAGEEDGLVGSRFYARHMTKEQIKQTRAMINIDCLGLSTTAVEVNRGDQALLDMLSRAAATMKLPIRGVNVDQVGISDGESFAAVKIPRLTFHSLAQETLRDINSTLDQFNVIRWDDYYNSYLLIAAFLTYSDLKLD
jgi:hypothetical protein